MGPRIYSPKKHGPVWALIPLDFQTHILLISKWREKMKNVFLVHDIADLEEKIRVDKSQQEPNPLT